MRGSYPLLLDQNGWSVGGCRDATSLLRAVGVDLSRPAAHSPPLTRHDIEVHVEDPLSSYTHEYPQPPAATHGQRSPIGGCRRSSDAPHTPSINRKVQRFQLNSHPEPEVRLEARRSEPRPLDARTHNSSSRSSAASTATPRNSPRAASPRGPAQALRRQDGLLSGAGIQPQVQEVQSNHRDYGAGSSGGGRCGLVGAAAPTLNLPSMQPLALSQVSLCCSTPDLYYNEERLRQEPEPGLMQCCDAKVSCCPCCPCLEPYCPVGHMNTVCMALICSGIIVFIILSPLFHYLIPT